VVAFGSSARSARQMMLDHPERGFTLMRLRTLWPFPEGVLRELAREHEAVVVAEMNTGQLVLEVSRVVGGGREASRGRPAE